MTKGRRNGRLAGSVLAAGGLVVGLVLGGVQLAVGQSTVSSSISACISPVGGVLRVPADGHCLRNEKTLTWNQAGAQGPTGPTGPPGPAGPPGQQGPKGEPGGTTAKPAHILTVALSGGDFSNLGAALNSISDNSPTSRYLITVAPGVYPGGPYGVLQMKPWVDVQGSGSGVTVLTYAPLDSGITGIIRTADNSTLSDLTVFNDSLSGARAVDINGGSPVLRNVELHATNHNLPAIGVIVHAGSPTFENVKILADSVVNGDTIGLSAAAGTLVTIRNSSVTATGLNGIAVSLSPGAKAVISNTTVSGNTVALYVIGPDTVAEVSNSQLSTAGAGGEVVTNMGSEVSISDSTLTARGASWVVTSYGVLGASTVRSLTTIRGSRLASSSREVLRNEGPLDEMRVATSELSPGGGLTPAAGATATNIHCLYSYRPDLTPLSNSCN